MGRQKGVELNSSIFLNLSAPSFFVHVIWIYCVISYYLNGVTFRKDLLAIFLL